MSKFDNALKKYLTIFGDQEMYFVTDNRNLDLFSKNPNNTSADDVRMKVSAINDTEIRKLSIEEDVIDHIVKLGIDDRLNRNDLALVEDIAHISIRGQSYHLIHFASQYCNFHKPAVFPIYSDEHLEFYKRYIAENKLPLDPGKLNTYDVFSKALNDLVARLGLTGKMNYLQLRKFGWLYAAKVVQEANA